MGAFKLKKDLHFKTQQEIDRIQAIPVGQRNQSEIDFLTALAPYLTNEVHARDANGLILQASGNELPLSDSGFKKGATFILKNANNEGIYVNVGNESAAVWGNAFPNPFVSPSF